MLSVRSLFLDSCSLVKDFGNHKALGVNALRRQVTDCSVTHTVSSCVLWTEFIPSIWCIEGMYVLSTLKNFQWKLHPFFSIFVPQISPQSSRYFLNSALSCICKYSVTFYLTLGKLFCPSYCFRIYLFLASQYLCAIIRS